MWSAYALGFPHMVSICPCYPNMVSICPCIFLWLYSPLFWVWHCYGLPWTLHCPKARVYDVTMIWPLLFHGILADVSKTPDNALTMRMHGDYTLSIDSFFLGCHAICYTYLWNNPVYIKGRNCRLRILATQSLGYSINAWAVGPRTPYRVGGLAGDVMRAWVSHSLVNHWI